MSADPATSGGGKVNPEVLFVLPETRFISTVVSLAEPQHPLDILVVVRHDNFFRLNVRVTRKSDGVLSSGLGSPTAVSAQATPRNFKITKVSALVIPHHTTGLAHRGSENWY